MFNTSFSHKRLKRLIFKKHNQLSTPYQGIWRLNQSILGIETTQCRGLCWTLHINPKNCLNYLIYGLILQKSFKKCMKILYFNANSLMFFQVLVRASHCINCFVTVIAFTIVFRHTFMLLLNLIKIHISMQMRINLWYWMIASVLCSYNPDGKYRFMNHNQYLKYSRQMFTWFFTSPLNFYNSPSPSDSTGPDLQ